MKLRKRARFVVAIETREWIAWLVMGYLILYTATIVVQSSTATAKRNSINDNL